VYGVDIETNVVEESNPPAPPPPPRPYPPPPPPAITKYSTEVGADTAERSTQDKTPEPFVLRTCPEVPSVDGSVQVTLLATVAADLNAT
jgi:hypothetical protein